MYLSESSGKIKIKYYFLSLLLQMKPYRIQVEQDSPLEIGYYCFRGKVQIIRLLCQYLHIKYIDKYFTPQQWIDFKDNQVPSWVIKDIPYCRDKKFIVTGSVAIVHYILQKYGRTDLLGRNLNDQIKIGFVRSHQDIRNLILGLTCLERLSINILQRQKQIDLMRHQLEPLLLQYENECPEIGWYFGYITMMDFFIYQVLNQLKWCWSQDSIKFKRLKALQDRVYNIYEIRQYETSSRCIKECNPVLFFNKFKEQKLKIINDL